MPDNFLNTRIDPIDPAHAEQPLRAVFDAQTQKWGGPLYPGLLYGRRPTLFRGMRAMWGGIESSGLIDAATQALVNRRVAALNLCEF